MMTQLRFSTDTESGSLWKKSIERRRSAPLDALHMRAKKAFVLTESYPYVEVSTIYGKLLVHNHATFSGMIR